MAQHSTGPAVIIADLFSDLAGLSVGDATIAYALDTKAHYLRQNGAWNIISSSGESTGMLKMWAGLAAQVPAGYLVCDGSAVSRTTYAALFTAISTLWGAGDGSTTFNLPDGRGGYLKGAAQGADAGATGGALTHTHASHTSLVHAGTAVADHAAHTHTVTSNVSVANHVFTQATISWPAGVPTNADESAHTHAAGAISWPAGVPTNANESAHTHAAGAISWPAGVPTHSGTAISDHASHTHTYTDVVNHVHVQHVNSGTTGGTSGYTPDTSTSTDATSGYSTSNPTGGVATGTTAGPSATLTHTVSNQGTIAWPAGVPTGAATGAGSAHTHTVSWPAGVPTGAATGAGSVHTHTVSWPAGVPTNAGGAVDAHGVTNAQVTSGNPSATLTHAVTQPNDHAISAHDTVNHEPPFLGMIFLIKT